MNITNNNIIKRGVAVLKKVSILDLLATTNLSDEDRNKSLYRHYLTSRQTRLDFANALFELAMQNEGMQLGAQIFKFEDYLFAKEVPFKCSGTAFGLYDKQKEEVVNKVVFARNEKEAELRIIDEYEAKLMTVYEGDLSILEQPAEISRKQLREAM